MSDFREKSEPAAQEVEKPPLTPFGEKLKILKSAAQRFSNCVGQHISNFTEKDIYNCPVCKDIKLELIAALKILEVDNTLSTQHSFLPLKVSILDNEWESTRRFEINDSLGRTILRMANANDAESNGRLIVEAVNLFEPFKELLDEIMESGSVPVYIKEKGEAIKKQLADHRQSR